MPELRQFYYLEFEKMAEKEKIGLNFHIRHHSVQGISGSVNWYGEDYSSFCHALDVTIQRLKQIPLKTPTPITVHVHDFALSNDKINEWKNSYCSEKTRRTLFGICTDEATRIYFFDQRLIHFMGLFDLDILHRSHHYFTPLYPNVRT